VVVDSTVQEKNITFPTDSKLLTKAIIKLGKFARLNGIKLRQSYTRKAKQRNWQASGYAAARQFNRLERANQDLKNWLGRIVRDIEKKQENKVLSCNFQTLLEQAKRLIVQEKNSKDKLYSLHEPEVCCMSKKRRQIADGRRQQKQEDSIVKSAVVCKLPSAVSPAGSQGSFEKAEEEMKVWWNTKLGLPWESQGGAIEIEALESHREEYAAEVPDGVLVLTCGVDTQDDRLEAEVVGWGTGKERNPGCLVSHRVSVYFRATEENETQSRIVLKNIITAHTGNELLQKANIDN